MSITECFQVQNFVFCSLKSLITIPKRFRAFHVGKEHAYSTVRTMSPVLLLVTLFASICLGQNYIVLYSWGPGATDCSGSYSSIVVSNNTSPGSCANTPCTCGVVNGAAYCIKRDCNITTVPADPPSAVAFGSYVNPNGCTGIPSFLPSLSFLLFSIHFWKLCQS